MRLLGVGNAWASLSNCWRNNCGVVGTIIQDEGLVQTGGLVVHVCQAGILCWKLGVERLGAAKYFSPRSHKSGPFVFVHIDDLAKWKGCEIVAMSPRSVMDAHPDLQLNPVVRLRPATKAVPFYHLAARCGFPTATVPVLNKL